MPWKLRPGWRASIEEGHLVVSSDVRSLRVARCAGLGSDLAFELSSEIGLSRYSLETLRLLEQLETRGLVTNTDPTSTAREEQTRLDAYFSHIGMDSIACRNAIESAVVTIIGVGGTGAIILQHLVGAGVRSFILADQDAVERTNLERQFIFGPEMIGWPKTKAAAAYIQSRCPDANIQTRDGSIASRADVQSLCVDVSRSSTCIVCIDRPFEVAVRILPQALWDIGVSSLQGGVMIRSGFYGPVFDPQRSPSTPEMLWGDVKNTEAALPVGVCFSPNNTIIASLMASQVLHHLIGAQDLVEYKNRTFVDLFRRQFSRLNELGTYDTTR